MAIVEDQGSFVENAPSAGATGVARCLVVFDDTSIQDQPAMVVEASTISGCIVDDYGIIQGQDAFVENATAIIGTGVTGVEVFPMAMLDDYVGEGDSARKDVKDTIIPTFCSLDGRLACILDNQIESAANI
ncbi:hypothetical protein RY27_08800 [Litorilinea aerophila]|nr:hypothetical protein RY27_08800 [Litorilinea aerophila]